MSIANSKSPASSRTLRVFVSSTFRDMFAEREELVKSVFPQLRQRCEERGVSLVEIDLRWGITTEEAAQRKVLPLCLDEVGRCSLFVGLLGERYGWVPTRAGIPTDLRAAHPWLSEHLEDSVTEMEIWHGALKTSEPRPCFFYFRDPLS